MPDYSALDADRDRKALDAALKPVIDPIPARLGLTSAVSSCLDASAAASAAAHANPTLLVSLARVRQPDAR